MPGLKDGHMATWFNSRDLSDCELKVTTADLSPSKCYGGPKRFRVRKSPLYYLKAALGTVHHTDPTKSYPGHKLVLKTSCGLFADGSDDLHHGKLYYFSVSKEEEFPAAEAVIKYMYKIDLEPGLSLEQLLQILVISEKYEVYNLPDVCVKKIRTLMAQSPSWQEVLLVLDHASTPALKVLLDPALKSAQGVVLQRFVDLEERWAHDSERHSFLQLPYESVLWLLAHPDLKVASENTVAVAIGTWLLDSEKAVNCTDIQKQELWKVVRGGTLGSYFLAFVIPTMPVELGITTDSPIYSSLIRARTTATSPRPATAATPDVYKPPRPVSSRTFASMVLSVPVSEMSDAFDKMDKTGFGTEFCTATEYFNGYFWTGMLKLANTTDQYRQYDKHFVALRVSTDSAGSMPCNEDRFVTFSVSSPGHTGRNAVRCYRRSSESPLLGYFGFLGSDWKAKAVDGVVTIKFDCKGLD